MNRQQKSPDSQGKPQMWKTKGSKEKKNPRENRSSAMSFKEENMKRIGIIILKKIREEIVSMK